MQKYIFLKAIERNRQNNNLRYYRCILLESIPPNGDNIRLFIEAMKTSRRITVTYRKYGFTEPSEHTVEPYCIKLFQRRWYALVRHITRDSLFTLSFDRIISIRLTEEHFKI